VPRREGQDVGSSLLEVLGDGGELAVEGLEDPVELGVHGLRVAQRQVALACSCSGS
jgi:hypothetical protein